MPWYGCMINHCSNFTSRSSLGQVFNRSRIHRMFVLSHLGQQTIPLSQIDATHMALAISLWNVAYLRHSDQSCNRNSKLTSFLHFRLYRPSPLQNEWSSPCVGLAAIDTRGWISCDHVLSTRSLVSRASGSSETTSWVAALRHRMGYCQCFARKLRYECAIFWRVDFYHQIQLPGVRENKAILNCIS